MRNAFLVLAAAVAIPAAAATAETERVSKTVPFAAGGTLRLKNFSGRVTITGTDRAEASIDAVRRAPQDRLDRIKLDIHTEGSTLVINANEVERSWLEWTRHNNVVETELDIKIPRRTNLDINVFSSPVAVDRVDGSHNVHGFSARLQLTDVNGPIKAHSFSGGVEITQSRWTENQSIDIDTFSGSVRLRLPDGARGAVRFNSFSGRLDSDIPLTYRSSGRRSVRAELGGTSDGGSVKVETFSGSFKINR